MTETAAMPPSGTVTAPARNWVRVLSRRKHARAARSAFELAVTLVPMATIWALALGVWLSLALSVLNAGFFVQILAIHHECGHGASSKVRGANTQVRKPTILDGRGSRPRYAGKDRNDTQEHHQHGR